MEEKMRAGEAEKLAMDPEVKEIRAEAGFKGEKLGAKAGEKAGEDAGKC